MSRIKNKINLSVFGEQFSTSGKLSYSAINLVNNYFDHAVADESIQETKIDDLITSASQNQVEAETKILSRQNSTTNECVIDIEKSAKELRPLKISMCTLRGFL